MFCVLEKSVFAGFKLSKIYSVWKVQIVISMLFVDGRFHFLDIYKGSKHAVKTVFLARLDEVQEELLYYTGCRRWRRCRVNVKVFTLKFFM